MTISRAACVATAGAGQSGRGAHVANLAGVECGGGREVPGYHPTTRSSVNGVLE